MQDAPAAPSIFPPNFFFLLPLSEKIARFLARSAYASLASLTWLSPRLAAIQCRALAEGLISKNKVLRVVSFHFVDSGKTLGFSGCRAHAQG